MKRLLATLALAGCSAAPVPTDVDNVAEELATNMPGELLAMHDVVLLSAGGLPAGFSVDGGIVRGEHDGVAYTYAMADGTAAVEIDRGDQVFTASWSVVADACLAGTGTSGDIRSWFDHVWLTDRWPTGTMSFAIADTSAVVVFDGTGAAQLSVDGTESYAIELATGGVSGL